MRAPSTLKWVKSRQVTCHHPTKNPLRFALRAFTYRLDCYRIYIDTVTRPFSH